LNEEEECGLLESMKPLMIRALTEDERRAVQIGLKSNVGMTVRRSQMVLMSAEEKLKAVEIAGRLGCSDQTVRKVLHGFEQEGVACLSEKKRGRPQPQRAFDEAGEAQLLQILEQSPRQHGYESSLWTLEMLAELSFQRGWTKQQVHLDTVSETLHRLGVRWKRAKQHISSPDGQYEEKKSAATG
jgi:transposase